MTAGAGHQTFETKMAKRGFDPSVIIAIIGALLPLLQNCFKPTPASIRRRANLPQIAQALREKDDTVGFFEARRRGKEILEVLRESSDDEIKAFINDSIDADGQE